jgi:hypothetical protein
MEPLLDTAGSALPPTGAGWRKSTYSLPENGGCVEAATSRGVVLVRDTTNRGGGTLQFQGAAWRRLTADLKVAA